MLHQIPAVARASATPVIDLADEMQVFDRLPKGCIGHVVCHRNASARIRAGEVVVVDTRKRRARSGATVLIAWRPDPIFCPILQTNYRKSFYKGRCWMVDPADRPTSREDLDRRIAAGIPFGLSDGPYTRERLEEATVGRVIGILLPYAAEVFRQKEEPPPEPPEGFSPAAFCLDLEKIGGCAMVDLMAGPSVGFQVPTAPFEHDVAEAEAHEAEAMRLTVLASHPGAKARLRSYALGIAEHVRRERPTGSWKMGGVVVVGRAEAPPVLIHAAE